MLILHLQEKNRLYQLGLEAFNSGRFYQAHEFWEEVWLHSPQPDKVFLQGLIQVAAAFHHYSRGNAPGTRSLLRKGLLKLDRFPNDYAGIEVEALRGEVRGCLRAIRAGKPKPQMALPRIQAGAGGAAFMEAPKANAGKSAVLRPSQAGRRDQP